MDAIKKVIDILKQMSVEPVFFLYMLAVFLQFPSKQDLIFTRICAEKFPNTSICDNISHVNYTAENTIVEKETSTWIMYTTIVSTASATIFTTFIWGPLGDRKGRKLPLLIPVFGSILANVNSMVVAIFKNVSLSYLLLGSLIDGLLGGFVAFMMAGYSYIGHVSSSKHKTARIGIVSALSYFSSTTGFVLSGIILDHTNFTVLFAIVVGILVAALLYTLVFIKNIQPACVDNFDDILNGQQNRRHRFYIVKSLKDTWLCLAKPRKDRATLFVALQVLLISILMVSVTGENDILLLYVKLPVFSWSQTQYGVYQAIYSASIGVMALSLPMLLRHFYDVRDTTIILVGFISRMARSMILATANETWHLYISILVGSVEALASVGLRSCMSSLVAQNEQGRLFGIVASMESLSMLIATLTFNNLYSATLEFYNGTAFLFSAGLVAIGFIIAIWMHVNHAGHGQKYQYSSFEEEVHSQNSEESLGDEVPEHMQPYVEEGT